MEKTRLVASLPDMSTTTRALQAIFPAKGTLEGAGVKLHRGFGYYELPKFDPFLLFDDFSSPQPADYLAGFPWHPHRGIETVTYVLEGNVAHQDSLGHAGTISNGAVQWMSAGKGIIHQEMPQGLRGLKGFQLWVNLPKQHKMSAPQYQEFRANEIPAIAFGPHAQVKVIAGQITNQVGPVHDIAAQPLFVDVQLKANQTLDFPVVSGHTVFLYVFEGNVGLDDSGVVSAPTRQVLLLEPHRDLVHVKAGSSDARFLLVSGQPLNEPIAWNGPIVMNTAEELEEAFQQLQSGVFIS